MNLVLLSRAFREARLLLLGCMIAMFGFCMIRVWIVGQVDMSRFQGILEILRPEFEKFSPLEFDQVITYPGRVAMTFTEPMVLLLMIVWAIARGSTAVSGPLSQGTLEMLLAQPISRLQWLTSNMVVTVLGVLMIGASAWGGVYVGMQTTTVKVEKEPITINLPAIGMQVPLPFTTDEDSPERVPITDFVDAEVYIPSALNLMGIGLFFAGLTTFMSSWDRYRWRTIGIVSAVMISQMILRVLSLSIDGQAWLASLTIFSWYEPEVLSSYAVYYQEVFWQFQFETKTGDTTYGLLAYLASLLIGSIACYLGAFLIFQKRDLPAPI